MRVTYFQDPGHGWISVPLTILADWEIKPSKYSYRDGVNGYLEEDMDAGLFMRAARERGVPVEIVESHSDSDHWIRNLRHF